MTDTIAFAGADLADPLPLAQALIRCPSVTPEDAGAIDVVRQALMRLGFACTELTFGRVRNLSARLGDGPAAFCFAGHTDVVPTGAAAWSVDPFAAEVRDGVLYGRGAVDMKGNIAAFLAATARLLSRTRALRGAIALVITGDEEGEAIDGTAKVVEWLAARGEMPRFVLVGEPTSVAVLGDTVKIGRRGSLTARLAVDGVQGHVAYPQRADNPVHRLVRIMHELIARPLDEGTAWFEPSSLQITSIDVGNPVGNVIPARAEARLAIRFNDRHTRASLEAMLRTTAERHAQRFTLEIACSGEAFLTEPGPEVARLTRAIAAASGVTPRLDTGGGISDARFFAPLCPVAEFGLVGSTMHQADERVPVAELRALSAIYERVLEDFVA
ncbi:succinyl-diaminopimelate desuccinylase [Elioraea thermophila]|uniref:succinyl-diaminopimelate desuccinylase n=1 Tax=Elioraea thermophila TaxID=2185104 RepID=UPI001E404CD1|nr:succinyl-diaminopimelate desuccinylase [Elioraea thermophila]